MFQKQHSYWITKSCNFSLKIETYFELRWIVFSDENCVCHDCLLEYYYSSLDCKELVIEITLDSNSNITIYLCENVRKSFTHHYFLKVFYVKASHDHQCAIVCLKCRDVQVEGNFKQNIKFMSERIFFSLQSVSFEILY